MAPRVAVLDPTAHSQQQWFDVLRASPHTPDTAVIRTTTGAALTTDFYRALAALPRLPALEHAALHLSAHRDGRRGRATADQAAAAPVLRAFFEATAQTHGRVRTLTIKNLPTDPATAAALAASPAFGATMAHVDALHLHMCTSSSSSSSDGEGEGDHPWAGPADTQRFWTHHLRTDWLAPVAPRLTRLTLYADNWWGVWPRFDTTGLVFPRLTSLALGSFVFGLDAQLDWLAHHHKTLRHLQLDGCAICTRWEVADEVYQDRRGGHTLGAFVAPRFRVVTPFAAEEEEEEDGLEWWVLGYDGTWARYFGCIARDLPGLRDFRFNARWQSRGDAPGGSMPDRRAEIVFDARDDLETPPLDAETHPRYLCYSTMNGYEPTVLPDPDDASLTPTELDREEQRALQDLLRLTRARATST